MAAPRGAPPLARRGCNSSVGSTPSGTDAVEQVIAGGVVVAGEVGEAKQSVVASNQRGVGRREVVGWRRMENRTARRRGGVNLREEVVVGDEVVAWGMLHERRRASRSGSR